MIKKGYKAKNVLSDGATEEIGKGKFIKKGFKAKTKKK